MTVLDASEDAFGRALADVLAHGEPRHVLVLEEAGGRSRPAMAPGEFFAPHDAWPEAERTAVAFAAGPVVDLGCGAGRHALHLQDVGLAVTGVDISPGAVAVACARGVRDVRLGDLRDPPTDRAWGTVLLMCGNLGLAGDRDATRLLLTRLAHVASPDALLIGDTVDPTEYGGDGTPARLRLAYGPTRTPWWDLFNIPRAELPGVFEDTGWRLVRRLDDGGDYWVVAARG